MKAKARAAQMDVVDLGMGNPDGATPQAGREQADRGGAQSAQSPLFACRRGIPQLREEIVKRYKRELRRRSRSRNGSDRHHRRQGRAGASAVRDHRTRRAVVSPNPAYPIHQYGVIMAEGHACMLPMPDAGDISRTGWKICTGRSPQAEADSDFVSAQSDHARAWICDFFREIVELARAVTAR